MLGVSWEGAHPAREELAPLLAYSLPRELGVKGVAECRHRLGYDCEVEQDGEAGQESSPD